METTKATYCSQRIKGKMSFYRDKQDPQKTSLYFVYLWETIPQTLPVRNF